MILKVGDFIKKIYRSGDKNTYTYIIGKVLYLKEDVDKKLWADIKVIRSDGVSRGKDKIIVRNRNGRYTDTEREIIKLNEDEMQQMIMLEEL